MTDDRVTRLIEMLDDLEADVDETIDLADAIAASGDLGLLPRLESELDRAVADRNAYGRELLGGVVAALGGPDRLPVLIRASAVDLGDDQDGLAAEIVDLVQADPKTARRLLQPLTEDDDLTVANRADWALRFAP
ncbi:hypothetical protein [Streptomyces showdoensis]|uniref:HEAT repeat domain-containing protein n=1 Tax=Streptomyces showdoensis TaxID=68268 RepID=A0A2P2GHL1_STREW|nr:hypothetical protein [Streptomyces showdoensis]KKZ70987.1 hypothetical protein VO63_26290 [Streptomyces showdoensis]